MAHTLATDKNTTNRDGEEITITIIEPDQEAEIVKLREKLTLSRAMLGRGRRTSNDYRKRYRNTSSTDDGPPLKRLRSSGSRRDIRAVRRKAYKLDNLTDDLLVEVFRHLDQLPHLLNVRQVCTRWYVLSCHPRLWRTLSFKDQEHVSTENFTALCNNSGALKKLHTLSLAKVHGVLDAAVRLIPRTDCAATLQSVDLSWCSGATDRSVVEFSRCPGLRELRLSHCKSVTRRSVRILAVRCPRLEVLDINCISGVRDSLLEVIGSNCPYLKVLNIANARNVTDDGVSHIANGCHFLEALDLSWCGKVTDWSILKIAQNIKNLREVGLSETRVTDVGIQELTRACSKLEALHLARCIYVTNRSVESIMRYCKSRLRSLNLASCQSVSDDYVEELIKFCPSLKCLDVSKLPCRMISEMLERETATRDIQVYF